MKGRDLGRNICDFFTRKRIYKIIILAKYEARNARLQEIEKDIEGFIGKAGVSI